MLDLQYIRDNKEAVAKAIADKNLDIDLDAFFAVDEERRALLQKVEECNAAKNDVNNKMKSVQSDEERQKLIAEGSQIKKKLETLEPELKKAQEQFDALMVRMPTVPAPDAPIGKDEDGNVEVGKWGTEPQFAFAPKDHIALGTDLDILDLERGAKVGGYRGYYLKGDGAALVMAIMLYAFHKMVAKGYMPMIPPTLVKGFALFGSGHFKGMHYNPQTDEVYRIDNEEEQGASGAKEDKFLVGTAEPSLLAYYANETLQEDQLPMKLCGYSQCYRSEIGSYGKDTKGMYRVHEFMKIEQVVLAPADVNLSEQLQQEMLEVSKEMHDELGLCYRQLAICTGDMGVGKYRQYDLEAWLPGLQRWAETGSASNLLDWQARRNNVKYTTSTGKKKHVYMLNNTALPSPRIFIAILENFQREDGSVVIPKVLRPFMPGKKKVIEKPA